MFSGKRGMEIAISSVVGIILGALMLFAGIFLLTNIVDLSNKTYDQVVDQMRLKIDEALVNFNDAIYIHERSVKPIRKQDFAIFGGGINNMFDVPRNFSIMVTHNYNLDDGNVSYIPDYYLGARQKEAFFIVIPTKNLEYRTQYTFILNVTYYNDTDWLQYDRPVILSVTK
jgi:hypothetical protein